MSELTIVSDLDSLQSDFEKVNEAYSQNMSSIASGIKFDNNDTAKIKEQLIEFAAEQERIANHESLGERFLRKVSNVPLIGTTAKSSADGMRNQRLSEESVSGLVGTMYQGLKKQASDVETTESSLISIHEATTSNLATMEELELRLSGILSQDEVPMNQKSRVMRMHTHIKVMIEKSKDKLSTLQLIINSTQATLETIYRELPVSEADLLSDLAMNTSVSQINALSQDVKEMRELSEIVSNNIWTNTQKSIVNLLELNTVTEKDILRIENNAKKREELHRNTMEAAQKSSNQIKIAHTKITAIAEESNQARLAYQAENTNDTSIQ